MSRPTGKQLVAIKDRIAKGFNESHWRELGALTDTLSTIDGHSRLLRSLSWHDEDYEGNVIDVVKTIIDANPDNCELLMDFLNRKFPVDGESVSAIDGVRKIVFTPLVFSIPEEQPEADLISVMIPFDLSFKPVFKAIKKAAEATGHRCLRADDIWEDSTVIQDVFSLIYRSAIVVCDFTGRNPNVFYETGIAHTLGKYVVPITQHADDAPFDVKHHRHAKYLNNTEGLAELTLKLQDRFALLAQRASRGV